MSPRHATWPAARVQRRRAGTSTAAGLAAIALGAAACSGAATGATSPLTGATPTSTASTARTPDVSAPVSTTSSAATATSDPGHVRLAFGGDVHFADYVGDLLRDPQHSLAELRTTLGAADFAMVNLETAITSRGTRQPKEFHFRTSPAALVALQAAGVDAVTMANNHGVDYGPVGLADTLAARRSSPIPVVGIGADAAEAFAPAMLTVKGLRVAVIGSTQVNDYTAARFPATGQSAGVATNQNITRLRTAVQRAAASSDLVVVYLHWGIDYTTCADPSQTRTARALEAAGADIIVGGHAHRVQGAGWLGRSYVDYGLGNFVWWRSAEPDSRSGVLTLTVDAKAAKARGAARGGARHTPSSLVTGASWTPMLVGKDGVPREPSAAKSASLLSAWEKARGCTDLRGTARRGASP